jgi:hypothetical protein
VEVLKSTIDATEREMLVMQDAFRARQHQPSVCSVISALSVFNQLQPVLRHY